MENRTLNEFRSAFENNSDFGEKTFTLFGHDITIVFLDSMTSKSNMGLLVIKPLLEAGELPEDEGELLDYIEKSVIFAPETRFIEDIEEAKIMFMSGYAVIFADSDSRMLFVDMKDFEFRSTESPDTEITEFGSRETFVEVLNKNISMMTRRLKTNNLKFEDVQIGRESHNKAVVCDLENRAPQKTVNKIKELLENADMGNVMEAGYLKEILADSNKSIFSTIGMTIRPDICCSKITEGRVAVLVDGSPEALYAPYLMIEHFQTPDDYINRPYFAFFVRMLKVFSALISVLLTGIYIALVQFNPEVIPSALLYNIIDSNAATPFSVTTEAVFMMLLYELMREAGLRLPKSMGQSVSIVGSLVIGEAAVSSGIVGAPTVIIAAIAAIASFVIPDLHNQISLLRIAFIIVGAVSGIYGIAVACAALLVSICSVKSFGVPIMSPVAPLDAFGMRDTFYREGWRKLGRRSARIQNMRGSDGADNE
ncbi:MAG: spore germination protein [Acutalibacteraceae bacterium]